MQSKVEKVEKSERKKDGCAKNGGAREGAGRKPKEIEIPKLKKLLKEYLSEEEVIELVEALKQQAKKKPELLKFVLEQIFGKAAQQVEMNHSGKLEIEHDIKQVIERVYDSD